MAPSGEDKVKLTVTITISGYMRVRMLQLGIDTSSVLKSALKAKIREAEEREALLAIRKIDPRVTLYDLRENSARIRQLKRMASVENPSVEA